MAAWIPDRSAVDWLLGSQEPAVRLLARREVLGEQVAMDPAQVLAGAKPTALLSGQRWYLFDAGPCRVRACLVVPGCLTIGRQSGARNHRL